MRAAAILLAAAALALADRVVERDGNVLKGSAAVSGDAVRLGPKTIPFDGIFLVERDDGTLLYAPDFAGRLRGYEYLAQAHLRDECVKLVRDCFQVKDFELAAEALDAAERAGVVSAETSEMKARIQRAFWKRETAPSARLRKRWAEISAHHGRLVADRAQRELERGKEGPRLLREALRLSATEPGLAVLQRIAPKDFPIGDARVWLDWHVDLEEAGARIIADDAPAVIRARKLWRPDLHGVTADDVLLVTPVKDSYTVGRCLAHGRLLARVLGELFATKDPVRAPAEPMLIFLFANREEYKTTTGTGRSVEDPASLEWTAGHYTPGERVSRFFWDAEPDVERRLAGTCMHELTHQWLEERNPRANPKSGIDVPGFWIVEGFATFMEEGVYDVATGAFSLRNPRSRSLDVLASASPGQLIPWKDLYALSQAGFAGLRADDRADVVLKWWLRTQVISTRRMFYEQAAATCHFLFHGEDGRHREALLAYVDAWYEGKRDRLDVERAFGMTAKDLGARTLAFAKGR